MALRLPTQSTRLQRLPLPFPKVCVRAEVKEASSEQEIDCNRLLDKKGRTNAGEGPYTVKKLKEIAKKLNVRAVSGMGKKELVKLLRELNHCPQV